MVAAYIDSLIVESVSGDTDHEPRPPTSPKPQRSRSSSPSQDAADAPSVPAADSDVTTPTHRLKICGDGRCAIRAALAAAGVAPPAGVDNIRTDTSRAALEYLREQRIAAAEALVEKMKEDEEFANFVRWSFPDEAFETFEDWLDGQRADDTDDAISSCWHGGGQWMLYGLGLLLNVKIVVHIVESSTLELSGPQQGTEVVDARDDGDNESVVRLASMRSEDGDYDHFDVLLCGDDAASNAEAEPLGPRALIPARSSLFASASKPSPSATRLLGWAALNALFVALYLQTTSPEGPTVSERLTHAAQIVAQVLENNGGSAPTALTTCALAAIQPVDAGMMSEVTVAAA